MLEQKAAGKIKCNSLPRAVSAPPGTFDAVRNGLADLSFTVQGYTPGRFVTTQIAEFPFLGDSAEATVGGLPARLCQDAGDGRTSTRASRCWRCSRTARASSSTPSGRSPTWPTCRA